MASAFGHAAVALASNIAFAKEIRKPGVILAGVICSILPDADVLAFKFGIPYEHWLGHRGITHSFFFALLFSFVLSFLLAKLMKLKARKSLWLSLFLCLASHGILDAMTTGGAGVALLGPFDNDRYFLPYRMITVSPLGVSNFFSPWGLKGLINEFKWIGIPCLIFWVLIKGIRSSISLKV